MIVVSNAMRLHLDISSSKTYLGKDRGGGSNIFNTSEGSGGVFQMEEVLLVG
jgi:hypothetical protein